MWILQNVKHKPPYHAFYPNKKLIETNANDLKKRLVGKVLIGTSSVQSNDV
jgi:hypothetical protein